MTEVSLSQKTTGGRWHDRVTGIAIQFALLFLFWLVLSGHYGLSDIIIGAIAAGLITALTNDLFYSLFHHTEGETANGGNALRQFGHFFAYIPWLLIRIINANIQVARLVLHPRMPVDPAFLVFRTGLRRGIARVMLANSITLTPGTVTVGLDEDRYLIHALVPSAAQEILEAAMQNKVGAIFGEQKEPPPSARWAYSLAELER